MTWLNTDSAEASFESFYRDCAKSLWFYLVKCCGDSDVADDIFQESFVRFLRAETHALTPGKRRAYLFKIATHLFIDHKRRDAVHQKCLTDMDIPEGDSPAHQLWFDAHELLERFDARERSLLWLAHVEGYTHREIASIHGLQAKSVRVLLYRLRKRAADMLKNPAIASEGSG